MNNFSRPFSLQNATLCSLQSRKKWQLYPLETFFLRTRRVGFKKLTRVFVKLHSSILPKTLVCLADLSLEIRHKASAFRTIYVILLRWYLCNILNFKQF